MKTRPLFPLLTVVVLLLSLLFTSCRQDNKTILSHIQKIPWQNSSLQYLYLDSAYLTISPTKEGHWADKYRYSLSGDTIIVNNISKFSYNLNEFRDTVSLLKFIDVQKDSFRLTLLNEGAAELFQSFHSLVFYNTETLDRFDYYVEPDTICADSIKKALSDALEGRFVLQWHTESWFRQEREFARLLASQGISYVDIGPPDDVYPTERNCYKETMDYLITKEFGPDLIPRLLAEADTLMLRERRNEYFKYYLCDKPPYPESRKRLWNNQITLKTTIPVKKYRHEWTASDGEKMFAVYHPFMDIKFHMDENGQTDNFRIGELISDNPQNQKYKDQLFKLAVDELKSITDWVPAEILGEAVKTDYNVRVTFEHVE